MAGRAGGYRPCRGRTISAALPWRRRGDDRPAILLLRFERVGDLLMTLDAIGAVRAAVPARDHRPGGRELERTARAAHPRSRPHRDAERPLAGARSGQPLVRRHGKACEGLARPALRRGDQLRGRRSQPRAPRPVGSGSPRGFRHGGRRADADRPGGFQSRDSHAIELAAPGRARVRLADWLSRIAQAGTRCEATADAGRGARTRASLLAARSRGGTPVVVVHAGGGREIKQWNLARFAEVANRLSASHGASIVLSGSAEDRPLVDQMKSGWRDARSNISTSPDRWTWSPWPPSSSRRTCC